MVKSPGMPIVYETVFGATPTAYRSTTDALLRQLP